MIDSVLAPVFPVSPGPEQARDVDEAASDGSGADTSSAAMAVGDHRLVGGSRMKHRRGRTYSRCEMLSAIDMNKDTRIDIS